MSGIKGTVHFTVDGVESAECPRSAISGQSARLVGDIIAAGWVKSASGAWPGGLNIDEWDAREHDFLHILELEKARVDEAEREARG